MSLKTPCRIQQKDFVSCSKACFTIKINEHFVYVKDKRFDLFLSLISGFPRCYRPQKAVCNAVNETQQNQILRNNDNVQKFIYTDGAAPLNHFSDNFERPRQQNYNVPTPEVAQYSASQKLLNPNDEPVQKKRKPDETTSETGSLDISASSPSSSFVQSIVTKPRPDQRTFFTTPKRIKFKSPALPKVLTPKESEEYIDSDPEINKFLEQQKIKNKESEEPQTPKRRKTGEEELKEELQKMKEENEKLSNELKKARHNDANRKYRKKQIAEKKADEDEDETYDLDVNETDFSDFSQSSRYRIINEIWDKLQKDFSKKVAAQIIAAVYDKKVEVENKKLTAAQTLRLLKDSGITIRALRKIRSNLYKFGAYNPFASDKSVNQERARIHESVKFKKDTVMMCNTSNGPKSETDVYYRESVFDELKERVDGIISAGNYKPFYIDGEEIIAGLITQDKATDFSKVCMGIGNNKAPINSAHALSLLCYFKANDSQDNLYESLDRENGIGPQIDNIKEITVTVDGVTKTLKVKWFVIGDFKFLNAIAGLNSNSCSFPCWGCEQKAETKYSELNIDLHAAERTMRIDASKSQIREPLFKSIPFDRYIPPILHITLGPGAQLFEALCERARKLDSADLQNEHISEVLLTDSAKKQWESYQEQIRQLNDNLEQLIFNKTLFDDIGEGPGNECESKDCVSKRDGLNVDSIYEIEKFCTQCDKTFHKCCLYKGRCPNCVKSPTVKQSKDVITQDCKDIEKQIKQIKTLLNDEEAKVNGFVSKYKLGRLAKNVESVLEKHGGTRKAYFQSFTGKQLLKMGERIREMFFEFDQKLQEDSEINIIIRAIIKFFDIKKLLTTKVLQDDEIDIIEAKIKDFANYMIINLPNFRVLQKGHVFFKHLVPFMRKFKISAYFTDEAIESFHVIFNRYHRRIGNRTSDNYAELMFKYNKEDTYFHDRFGSVELED